MSISSAGRSMNSPAFMPSSSNCSSIRSFWFGCYDVAAPRFYAPPNKPSLFSIIFCKCYISWSDYWRACATSSSVRKFEGGLFTPCRWRPRPAGALAYLPGPFNVPKEYGSKNYKLPPCGRNGKSSMSSSPPMSCDSCAWSACLTPGYEG